MTISRRQCVTLQCGSIAEHRNLCPQHYSLSKSRLTGIINRCDNKSHWAYKYYGGRGINICDRWRFGIDNMSGWETFLHDMGAPPKGLTLDRINNDGNYEPSNCRWTTMDIQNRNQARQKNSNRCIYRHYGGYRVQFNVNKHIYSFGTYATPEEAISVRDSVGQQIDACFY
jgi:hypothetical protein